MAEENTGDTGVVNEGLGLGLEGFLKGTSGSEGKPEDETTEGETSPKETETAEGEKPSQEDGKEKVEDKPKEEKVDDTDKKTEGKPEGEAEKVEPSSDYEKRYKDTQKWAMQVSNDNAQLKKDIESQRVLISRITKQIEGTWTDEDEANFEQANAGPSPEEAAAEANTQGRIDASREAAISIYGEEEVAKLLYAPDAPFRAIETDPIVRAKVLSSSAPVIEAIKIVKARQFYDKWGYDPATIESNIRKQAESELKEKITKEILDKFKAQGTIPKGLGDVKSSDVKDQNTHSTKRLSELFDS